MDAKNLIKKHVNKHGISFAELSRRTGIPYNRVRRTLEGQSRIKATDFVAYCKVLKIEVE